MQNDIILPDIIDKTYAAASCVITALIYKAVQDISVKPTRLRIHGKENIIQFSSDILGIGNDDCFLVGGYSINYSNLFADVKALRVYFYNNWLLSGTLYFKSKNIFFRESYDFRVPLSYQHYDKLSLENKRIFIFINYGIYDEIKIPERCCLPSGSSFPLRKSILTAMRRAKIKLSKRDSDYTIDFEYCAKVPKKVPKSSISHIPVNSFKVTLEGKNCSDLRKVVNHKNQYDILLDIFANHGWLDSHEYRIELDDKGELSKRVFIFQFKMIELKS